MALDEQERQELKHIISTLSGSSQKVRRANMLLQADVNGPGWTDNQIAQAYHLRPKSLLLAGVMGVGKTLLTHYLMQGE